MPYGNPGGYRKTRRNGRRGGGSNAALVSALQSVLQRFGGGGRRGSTTGGRLGKGTRAAARTKAHRVGDVNVYGGDEEFTSNYADGRGPLRVGHRM